MIKNNGQLKRTQARLEKVMNQIDEFREQHDGIEREILVTPLLSELEELQKEIQEYRQLRNMSFEEAVKGPLSEPELIDNIGQILAKLRIAAKLTQEELARRLGWEQSNISRFESENYNSQTIAKVVEFASALDVWLHVTPSLTEKPTRVRFVSGKHLQRDDLFFKETGTYTEFDEEVISTSYSKFVSQKTGELTPV